MQIARVRDGIVVNIEVVEDGLFQFDMVDSNGDTLVEYDHTTRPHPQIGEPYDPVLGFGGQLTFDDLVSE